MVGECTKAVDKGKARPVKHLNQAALGRVKSYVVQALVVEISFIHKIEN
jgi:hypothetical protein